jgi:hypothetical protein
MIKVRILQGVAAAGAAAFALPSLAGCTADASPDPVGSDTANNTESVAGSGNLALHSYSLHYTSTSGGDEFLRVGEKMTVAVAWSDVLDKLAYQFDPSQAALRAALAADPTKVKLRLEVTYTQFDESKIPATFAMSWAPGAGGALVGTSPEFMIPKGAKLLSVEVLADYDKNGTPATAGIIKGQGIPSDFIVFGAYVPNKLALFDTLGAERRTRIVEGGGVVPGAHALLSYTDWRLDTVTGKVGMDLRVGQKTSGSRFGPVVIDALGSLDYEVTAAISTEGGATYVPTSFSKVMHPAVLSRNEGWRYTLEADLAIPASASGAVKIAFHVKAFLQVPNYAPGEIQNARYAPGARILLADVWDNNDGKDYSLAISQ